MTRVCLILSVACSKSAPAPPPAPAPAPARTPVVSFSRDVMPVLTKQCAEAKGCHGDKPTDSVHMDLRPSAAYAQLVNAASEARKGGVRVKPGDVASSFLVDKLAGTQAAKEGKTMPLDPDFGSPIEPSPLPPGFLDDVLKAWIAAGAPNN